MSSRWRKRLFAWGLVAGVVVGLWVFRAVLLREAARVLVADEACPDATAVSFDPDCDGVFDILADLVRQDRLRRVVLVAPLPLRIAQVGLVPGWEEICRKELQAREVSDRALVVIGPPVQDAWQHAERLARWLADHPHEKLLVLCDRFDSARRRAILHRALGAEARRVRVRGLPRFTYDETNWWQSRTGWKRFADAWMVRLHTACVGPPHDRPAPLDLPEFERMVAGIVQEEQP